MKFKSSSLSSLLNPSPQSGTIVEITLLLGVLVLSAFGIIYYQSNMKANEVKEVAATDQVQVPSDAVKISGCIPYMGEHWVRLADLPKGPFYVVNEGKVLGIEYMLVPDDIPGEKTAKMTLPELTAYMQQNKLTLGDLIKSNDLQLDLFNYNFKTWDMHWTAPHPGLVQPHYDTHFYFVSQDELKNVCPNSGFEEALPFDLMQQLDSIGVPIPK